MTDLSDLPASYISGRATPWGRRHPCKGSAREVQYQPTRAGSKKIMMQISGRSFVIAFLVGTMAYFVLVSASAANTQSIAGLDQLISREKWDEAGLNKLTVAEQQTLAGDITLLLAAAQTTENRTAGTENRSQWRRLQRHMTKDDVRKLLGEPKGISVSKFAESWYYVDGTVTYNGKGRLDMWSEL
jgi:uncharacterized protein YchJ